jgi:phenylacetate-CoA ligase
MSIGALDGRAAAHVYFKAYELRLLRRRRELHWKSSHVKSLIASAEHLKEMAHYLVEKVPYFKGRQPHFFALPTTTKLEMMTRPAEFVCDEYSSTREYLADLIHDRVGDCKIVNLQIQVSTEIIVEQTTGTTGAPGRFPKTKAERTRLAIAIWRRRKHIDPLVSLNNFFPLVHFPIGSTIDQRMNSSDASQVKELYLDAKKAGMRWLHVNPRRIRSHINLLKAAGIDSLLGIFSVVENTGDRLNPSDMRLVSEFFGCKVVNQYGCGEAWAIGYDTEGTSDFEIIRDNVHVEILRPGSMEVIDRPGEVGEVAITSPVLRLFPIVRYRNGDRAEWTETENGFRLRLHEDRTNNLLLCDGELQPGSRFFRNLLNNAYHHFGYLYYKYIQFVQVAPEEVEVHLSDTPKSEAFFREMVATLAWLRMSRSPLVLRLRLLSPQEVAQRLESKRSLFVNRLDVAHFPLKKN